MRVIMSQNGETGGRSPHRRRLLTGFAIAAITVGILALVEGLTGIALLVRDLSRETRPGLPSRRHSDADTLLGWINTPGFRDPDMYGPRIALVINARSMRDAEEAPDSEPAVLRIVCAGDSFTFGVDVGDDDTWCAGLEHYDARIRTLNLGHPGYGFDQSYLHYRRNGEALEHAVHIFAFIPDDIRRIRLSRFAGYDKPYYTLSDGVPQLRNVPVPRMSGFSAALHRRRERLDDLHIVQLARRLSARMRGSVEPERVNSDADAREIAVALMDSLGASAREHDRIAVFVLLEQVYGSNSQNDELAAVLREELARRGLTFLDLRAEVRRLPADSLEAMFDRTASGHYSVRGHERVAASVWRMLDGMAALRSRLAALPAH